jgi:translation initiation factor IF-3
MSHPELAKGLLDRVAADLKDMATIEQQVAIEGRRMMMILAPSGAKAPKAAAGKPGA